MKRTLIGALAAGAIAALAFIALPATAQGPPSGLALATFGSGCFWCTEADFDKVEGVVQTISGYMGGLTRNPTYAQVSTGRTGHAEVVQITYDPAKVSYEKLLEVYWRNVDPLDASGQFCDKGSQYRPVIFTHTEEQKKLAEASKQALTDSKRFKQPIVVEIKAATDFTPAEDYHQDFYKKNPGHYYRYRTGCGRDARLEQLWGKAPTN
ncbi:MAG TPA: peptide-methionine (S)-S-oxide reductase MsrA [Hyphomicrobiaceae bacterium]|nr:peptide-methionine (S)-S-oxide reductase MsrA [Hyphomicrobiaceae bacterium]